MDIFSFRLSSNQNVASSKMRCSTTRGILLSALFFGGVFAGQTARVEAQTTRRPVISPSVKAASRLKYHPPRGWIRHYLGDDRYKIGTVWRVVTTPNDKFYYPPFASEILARPARDIIGFASAQDAEEAGYAPSSAYTSAYGLDSRGMAAADERGLRGATSPYLPRVANNSRRAITVVLPDRVSTILLPSSWEYVELPSATYQTPNGPVLDQNAVVRPRNARDNYILFGIQTMPRGSNSVALLRSQEKSLVQLRNTLSTVLARSRNVNNSASTLINNLKPQSVRIGGLRGLRLNMPNMPGKIGSSVVYTDSMAIVARGNKFYQVGTRGNAGGRGSSSVITSFKPR